MRKLYYITLFLIYWCLNPSPPLGGWWLRLSCQLFWQLPSLLWQLSWYFAIICFRYEVVFKKSSHTQKVHFLRYRDLLVQRVYYKLVTTWEYITYVACCKGKWDLKYLPDGRKIKFESIWVLDLNVHSTRSFGLNPSVTLSWSYKGLSALIW